MNKTEFIKSLSEEIGYSIEDCSKINDILENNFFISRKSKDKIINDLVNQFHIDDLEANRIYNNCASIITKSIKEKLKHPFKSKD